MNLNKLNRKIFFIGLMLVTLAMPFIELSFMRFFPDRDDSRLFISILFLITILFLFIIKPTVNRSIIFILVYVIFKSFQGGVYDVSFPKITISLLTFVIIFKWYEILRSENLYNLIFYLKKNNLILLCLLVLSSEINYFTAGNALPLLFQNLSITIILSYFFLMWLGNNKFGFNKNIFPILIIIVYMMILYLRRDNYDYYQAKFIIFFALIASIFFITLLFNRLLIRKTSLNKVRYIILILIISASILIFSYNYLLHEYSGLLERSNSASVRSSVNNVMLDLIHGSWDTTIFGHGLGSSSQRFEISSYYDNGRYYGDRNITAVAHSGLLIFYYEHGLLGVLLFLYLLYALLKNTPNEIWVDYRFVKEYNINRFNSWASLLQTLFLWMIFILLNLVIIASIPGPEIFWNSGLLMHMLLFMISSRLTLSSKHFLDMQYK